MPIRILFALLLIEQGYSPANPPEWIANLRPQVVFLSIAMGYHHRRH